MKKEIFDARTCFLNSVSGFYFMKRNLMVFLFVHSCASAFAQPGSWNILNAKLRMNQKWSLFGEAQIRSLKFYNHFHYYEIKGGAEAKIDKNFSVAFGLGNFDTYSQGGNFKEPMVNDEFRTWIQLSMHQQLKRVKFEHRYRAEQRFTLFGYRNRFRYRMSVVIPVKALSVQPKSYYINLSDELFFTNRAPYFERNRFFAGGGYVFSEKFTIQTGYMRQFDYRINDETGDSFFQISFLLQSGFLKKERP